MKLTVVKGAIDPPLVRMILSASANDDGRTVIETDDPRYAVAVLIDAVAADPLTPLPLLLEALCQSDHRKATQQVLRLAVACRDPLSEFRTICVDALGAEAALNSLLKAQAYLLSLQEATGQPAPHACAIHNLCEDKINALTGKKRSPYEAIRAKLADAAARERAVEESRIQCFAALRTALRPTLWQQFEHFAQQDAVT